MKIEELRKISEAATTGSWKPMTDVDHCYHRSSGMNYDIFGIGPRIPVPYDANSDEYIYQSMCDAKFIAQARNHFDALLEVVKVAKDYFDGDCDKFIEALEKLEAIE